MMADEHKPLTAAEVEKIRAWTLWMSGLIDEAESMGRDPRNSPTTAVARTVRLLATVDATRATVDATRAKLEAALAILREVADPKADRDWLSCPLCHAYIYDAEEPHAGDCPIVAARALLGKDTD